MYGQKTIRKRPLFHAPSISSEAGSVGKQSIGRTSIAARRSVALSRKSVVSEVVVGLRPDSKWLTSREYLLLLIEALLSLTSYVIRERNLNPAELERVNLTTRQAGVNMIYVEGYSSLLSLALGVLADSYFRHYTVALFTVILHFAAICLVFMEDTIKGTQKGNPYADLIWNVCSVSLVLIQASDFTRLVYGVTGMTNRKRSTVYIFIFLQYWVSSYATYGGIILNVFYAVFKYTHIRGTIIAFVSTGISLYLFVYFLYPEVPRKEHYGLGCRVVGCLFLASYYNVVRIGKRGKRGFFCYVEGKYDKTIITRTKEILTLYVLLLPALGIVFFIELRANLFYASIWDRVKSDKFTQFVGLTQLARGIMCITMLLSYFGLWPFLTLIGFKDKTTIKFLVGHLLAMVALFYAAYLMRVVETPQFSGSSGFTRIFNTRKDSVYFVPEDRDFTTHDFSVGSKKGLMVAYPCPRENLFAMKAYFNGTTTNFTMFLAVRNDETVGYMVLDPPEIIRIRGPFLPLREGPPGTNRGSWPKVYIYNSAATLQGTKIIIKHAHNKRTIREVVIQAGKMTTIALKPGEYNFRISRADIERIYDIEEGGVYGLMIYATKSSRDIEMDTVVPPNTSSCWAFLGLYILIGFAAGISYPTIRGMVFIVAPHGLPAMAFAFFAFLEGICMWIGYIGFKTWHVYMTANSMFTYSFGVTLFFFLCMFVVLKFRDSYT